MAPDQVRGPDSDGTFRLTTFGDASLTWVPAEGEPEEILGPGKPFAVFVYLVCIPGHAATREHLIDLLWTNLDLEGARHALRQALWSLRKRLGQDAIRSRNREVVLSLPVVSDRKRFLEAMDRQDFERAVQHYRGAFLPMFAAPGGAGFERWVDGERHRLRTQFLRAAESLVRDWLSSGEFEKAKELAARARDADKLNESTWRLLLEACLAGGDPARARIEAHALDKELEDLGQSPEPATRRLIALARNESLEETGQETGQSLEPELVGRERDFATILSTWREVRSGSTKHVHITGSAGVGKSRLLSEAKTRLQAMEARVVHLRAAPGERDVSYALTSDLATALAKLPGGDSVSQGAASTLLALNPGLSVRYEADPDRATGNEALLHRVIALAELVSSVAEDRPLAILVDDVHWADGASRQLLVSLLGRLDRERVLMVTTTRPVGEGTVTVRKTSHVSLDPLTEEETRALLASLASIPDEPWAEGFPSQLRKATGGSPLLILETVRFGLEEGWLALEDEKWVSPYPSSLTEHLTEGEALRRRLEQLPERESRLLLTLCVAGTPVSRQLLSRATDYDEDTVSDVLQELELRGLAAREADLWSPAHDEFAAAAMDMSDAEDLKRANLAVGRALARSAEGNLEVLSRAGRHLDEAGAIEDTTDVFVRWGRLARRRGDRRGLDQLAANFLARPTDDEDVSRLTGNLSLWNRLRLTPRRNFAAVAALAVLGLVVAGAFSRAGSNSPDAALLAFVDLPDGSVKAYHLPIARAGWEQIGTIEPAELGQAVPIPEGARTVTSVVPAPSAAGWAYAGVATDSGETEVYWTSSEGGERRLTHSPGDDNPESWSPDGTSLLMRTGRWGDNPWHDLAILDPESGDVRQLTRTEAGRPNVIQEDKQASWSRDGTRIAWHRTFITIDLGREANLPGDQLCWITVDGSTERCLEVGAPILQLVGWSGPWEVLAVLADSSGTRTLSRIQLDTGESQVLDDRVERATMSPDGRWLASLRRAESGVPEGWYVYPIDRPDLAVRLQAGQEEARLSTLGWTSTGGLGDNSYLDRVEIQAPDTLVVGVPTRLQARGFGPTGEPTAVPTIRWRVAESSLARLDPESGVLYPQRSGEITVHASAGGWRKDSVRLMLRPDSARMALSEEWDAELRARWVPYGTPYPTLASWPEGGTAFWNRSNDAYYSGVYSRREFPAEGGLGLQARLSTPRTAPRAQILSVGLTAWTNPESVERWDHRTGNQKLGSTACDFRYPGGDGNENLYRARTPGGKVRVDSVVPTGDPYKLRLQIFPDGTCGVALNGKPLARTTVSPPLEVPHRVILAGKSLETKMLVGSLEVWEGVRTDVDWTRLAGWDVSEDEQ